MSQINLTESDNGASFSVKKKDSILLRLEENPTTGYRWKIIEDTDFISFESTKFLMPEDPKVGQGGNRLFVFNAINSGTEIIKLKHWRQWEGDKSIIGRFEVTFVVGE